MFRYCETPAYYRMKLHQIMENPTIISYPTTEGTLIGHELGEWAGFTAGRLIVERQDGIRVEFRFGKDSEGVIPAIGSIVSIQHSIGPLPEIININSLEDTDIYQRTDSFLDSILLSRSSGVMLLVLAAICSGLTMILVGFNSGELLAQLILGTCGVSYMSIGYLLWYFTGE